MDLLDYLRPLGSDNLRTDDAPDSLTLVEFRLACSGTLLRANVLGDRLRSDASRRLLTDPFDMYVVSQPIDSWPQEICVRFRVGTAQKQLDRASLTYLPADEIVRDLCYLLSVLYRRLIVPVVKTREVAEWMGPSLPNDLPFPVIDFPSFAAWRPRAASVLYRLDRTEVLSNAPLPVALPDDHLRRILLKLGSTAESTGVMKAARQYALALELIEDRPETSYQLLIAATETLASAALADWSPPAEEQAGTKHNVEKLARRKGLSGEDARLLAIEASRGITWKKRKFVKFIDDRVADSTSSRDDLFMTPEWLVPRRETFVKVLSEVYDMRSGTHHSGSSFPPSSLVGTSHLIPAEVAIEAMAGEDARTAVPPVTWFERVVSQSFRSYLFEVTGVSCWPEQVD